MDFLRLGSWFSLVCIEVDTEVAIQPTQATSDYLGYVLVILIFKWVALGLAAWYSCVKWMALLAFPRSKKGYHR